MVSCPANLGLNSDTETDAFCRIFRIGLHMTTTVRKRRISRLFILFAVCFFFTAVILMKTAIQRYHEVRKYYRLQDYASEMHEISESLKTLEENSLMLEDEVVQLKKLAVDALQQVNATTRSRS